MQIISFQKLFVLSKYDLFWLSYESFSILSDAFLSKKYCFHLKQLWMNGYHVEKILNPQKLKTQTLMEKILYSVVKRKDQL